MYSPWAAKRRRTYQLTIGGILLVAFTLYFAVKLYRPPTCFDHKQNQDEVGVDCGGGICSLLCTSQTQELRTLWSRPYEVSPGWWSALAYVENPNFNAQARSVPYKFELYDKGGVLLVEKQGMTDIAGDPIVPVFVGRLDVGTREPYRVTFSWLEEPVWHRLGSAYQVEITEQELVSREPHPEIRATVQNTEPVPLEDIEVVVIVYDDEQNAIATSQTYIDRLAPRGKRNITFSWPQPFGANVGRIELLPRIPPAQ
jgi:hypothetical protein